MTGSEVNDSPQGGTAKWHDTEKEWKLRAIIQRTTAHPVGYKCSLSHRKTYPSKTSQQVSITALGIKSLISWSTLDPHVVALGLKNLWNYKDNISTPLLHTPNINGGNGTR